MPRSKQPPKAGSFFCRRCQRRIRVPKDWGVGAGTRRHYWAKHPEVMRPKLGRAR